MTGAALKHFPSSLDFARDDEVGQTLVLFTSDRGSF